MARTVDYSKKAEKIKEQIDELVQELMAAKSAPVVSKRSKYKLASLALSWRRANKKKLC